MIGGVTRSTVQLQVVPAAFWPMLIVRQCGLLCCHGCAVCCRSELPAELASYDGNMSATSAAGKMLTDMSR